MSAPRDDEFGFAPDYDSPNPLHAAHAGLLQRDRLHHAVSLGRTTPQAPFQPLKKPLAKSRVTIITTAAPYDPAKGDQGPGRGL